VTQGNETARRRSIVVGTDGSERAERAVDRAGELGHSLGVKVHVVSSYSIGSGAVPMAGRARGLSEADFTEEVNRTHAEQCVDHAQQRLERFGVESEGHVRLAEPADALLRIAHEQDAQMIIIGNRGMTGARRVLGSVPNRVSHRAQCDVLIVDTS